MNRRSILLLFFLFSIVLFAFECRDDSNLRITPTSGMKYIYSNSDTSMYTSEAVAEDEEYSIFDINKEPKEIRIKIIRDTGLDPVNTLTLEAMSIILDSLKTGVTFVPNDVIQIDDVYLGDINTLETLNEENIVKEIVDAGVILNEDIDVYVLLFEYSTFFNTANAIGFKFDDKKFIFGNAKLFNSAMLFVHELGHTYGLNHTSDSKCKLFNVMHESNIGCATYFTPQEAVFFQEDQYILPMPEVVFPSIIDTCLCERTSYDDNDLVKFISAKDRSIESENLVGQYGVVTRQLVQDINEGVFAEQFRPNFERQANEFFVDAAMQSYHVSSGIQGLKDLQINNIGRLICENYHKAGMDMSESELRTLFSGRGLDSIAYDLLLDTMDIDFNKLEEFQKNPCETAVGLQTGQASLTQELSSLKRSYQGVQAANLAYKRRNNRLEEVNKNFENKNLELKQCLDQVGDKEDWRNEIRKCQELYLKLK